jgi:Photosynthesis system II assembly factor YCF48
LSHDKRTDPIDAILARALAAAPADLTHDSQHQDCPNPEMLAGWYDRSLERVASARVDEHLAGCARCRMIVAALARADEPAIAPAAYLRGWRSILRPRLLVPVLTGAVAILAVAVVFVERGHSPMQVAQVSQVPHAANALEVPRAAANLAPSTPGESAQALAMNQPGPQARAARGTAVGGAISDSYARLPRMAAAAGEPRAGFSRTMIANAPGLPAGTIEIIAPDRSSWGIGRGGAIFHTDPSGAVSSQSSGVTADLTAGAAVSARVCWIVGKGGTVLHTTDGGEHWSQLSSPVVGDDLRMVVASSADDAMVIDSAGKRYLTSDAGATWSRR